jgi:hypothetical protein
VLSQLHVRYVDSDPRLASPNSFPSQLLQVASGRQVEIVEDRRQLVDVQLTSVQLGLGLRALRIARQAQRQLVGSSLRTRDNRWDTSNPEPRGRARKHLWFTGENVRPPSRGWNATLSFDLDSLGGANAYCPLWWYSVGTLGEAHSLFMHPAPTIEQLLQPRVGASTPEGFVAAFINNPQPMRFHAIRALEQVGKVDVFGRAVGKSIPNKAELAGRYRYILCFENDLYPGYVTEKPIEAWSMGAVPLWWGSDPSGYLNPQAVINAAGFASLQEFAAAVSHLDEDVDAWRSAFEQPLLARSPDISDAVSVVRRALE